MPMKMEAAWRYMVRKPMLIDKNQLEYSNVLFTNQKNAIPDSLSLPSVVQKSNSAKRNNFGNRTQLHSGTSPKLNPSETVLSAGNNQLSRNLAAENIRKS